MLPPRRARSCGEVAGLEEKRMGMNRSSSIVTALLLLALPSVACDKEETTAPPELGSIIGYIGDWSNGLQGMGGITVELDRDGFETRATQSEDNGRFIFNDLFPGRWWLVVEIDSLPAGYTFAEFESWERPVWVDAGEITPVTVRLQKRVEEEPGTITGTIMSNSLPVPYAALLLQGWGTTLSNVDGEYIFEEIGPGAYNLTITPPAGFVLAPGEPATKAATVVSLEVTVVNWGLVPSQ